MGWTDRGGRDDVVPEKLHQLVVTLKVENKMNGIILVNYGERAVNWNKCLLSGSVERFLLQHCWRTAGDLESSHQRPNCWEQRRWSDQDGPWLTPGQLSAEREKIHFSKCEIFKHKHIHVLSGATNVHTFEINTHIDNMSFLGLSWWSPSAHIQFHSAVNIDNCMIRTFLYIIDIFVSQTDSVSLLLAWQNLNMVEIFQVIYKPLIKSWTCQICRNQKWSSSDSPARKQSRSIIKPPINVLSENSFTEQVSTWVSLSTVGATLSISLLMTWIIPLDATTSDWMITPFFLLPWIRILVWESWRTNRSWVTNIWCWKLECLDV